MNILPASRGLSRRLLRLTLFFAAGLLCVGAATALAAAPVVPSITLTQVAAQAGGTLQFQVAVTSPAGTPTGIVLLLDGAVSLGSVTLQDGVALFSVAPPAIAPNAALTASYAGDQNFGAAVSPILVASGGTAGTGGAPTTGLTFATQPGSGAATVSPGATASLSFALGVTGAAAFSDPVSFSVTGLPAGAIASFTPGSLPAGAGAQTVQLMVQVAAPAAATADAQEPGGGRQGAALALVCLLLPVCARRARRMSPLLATVAALACAGLLSGCGITPGQLYTAPQTYTLQITAASGNVTRTVQSVLTVESASQAGSGQ